MSSHILGGISLLCLTLPAAAQVPTYHVTPAAKPGGQLQIALIGQPGQPFLSFLDLQGGPIRILGEEFYLGPGPLTLDSGTLGLGGLFVRSLQVPATGIPLGQVFYTQAVVADPTAPNGSFRATNGESTVLYQASQVMVEEFTDPAQQGYTGTFDRSRRHRLFGGAVRHRVHTVRPRDGVKFHLPILGTLNGDGARIQMVYRAIDLGANGEREVITALRWLPFGPVSTAAHKRLVIDAVHTLVVPDFTIDPFTALPKYPNSGLNTVFSANPRPGETGVRIVDSSYTIRPSDVRADGYVSYPAPTQDFVYDGVHSLLLDFKMEATPGLVSRNGQQIQLTVLTMAQPNARVHASGSPGQVVDPHAVGSGRGDNSMSYMQFEFASTESEAMSPWRKAPVGAPDYRTPSIAASVPQGTSLRVEFRGADDANGTGATPWFANIDGADKRPYLQYRIQMTADPRSGAVPSVESIVVPIN